MSCYLNKKRFLCFTYRGKHQETVIKAGMFMPGDSTYFKVKYKCILCGNERLLEGLDYSDMIRLRFTENEIQTAKHTKVSLSGD